jgi:hypothetical protein
MIGRKEPRTGARVHSGSRGVGQARNGPQR